MKNPFRRIVFWLFAILCIGVSLYPILYFIMPSPFSLLNSKPPELLANTLWNTAFYGHITFGGIALLIGWPQFIKKLRIQRPGLHRKLGITYVFAVWIGGLCGFYLGFFATGGWIAQMGFVALALVWLSTTSLAFIAAKKKDFVQHEKWMIFSYAACFAAVTLRLWMPILIPAFGAFIPAYRLIAWLCWVPNILVAWLIVRQIDRKIPATVAA